MRMLYGFESLSVKLDEEGNLNIPEQRIFQRLLFIKFS